MICFADTETTGLVLPKGTRLERQPYITELFMALTTSDFKIKNTFQSLFCLPEGMILDPFIPKLTGITDEMLKGQPTFKQMFPQIQSLISKADIMVLHNFTFDQDILDFSAQRSGEKIEWPKHKYCTVEQSMCLSGRRLKLEELYFMATGKREYGAHRAKGDVLATIEVFKMLHLQGGKIK